MKINIIFFCFLTCIMIVGCDKSNNGEIEVTEEVEVFDFTITSMNPDQGKVGDTITINGTNFSDNSSENIVDFDGVNANIINATPTTLEVIVPLQLIEGSSIVSLTIQDLSKTAGEFSVRIDDYKYIAVANNRRVYTIGNISGDMQQVGLIEQSESRSIQSRTLSNTETKIFGMTTNYLENRLELLIYDKATGQSNAVTLVMPSTIDGPYIAITALAWNEQNLVLTGLLTTNQVNSPNEYHVITINPVTYEVIDTGIVTPPSGNPVYSFILNDNKIYYSASSTNADIRRDLAEIDLSTNTSSLYYFDNITTSVICRLSKTNETNKIYAYRTTVGRNAIIPIEIDLIQNTVVDLTPYNGFTIVYLDGNSFYDQNTNQTIGIIGNNTVGYSLYKFNESSQESIDLNITIGFDFSFHILGIME